MKFIQKYSFFNNYLKIFVLVLMALPLRAKVVTAQDFVQKEFNINSQVMDTINILSPETESRLNQTIKEIEEQNGTEIIIMTVSDTKGYPSTEDFARKLLAYWSINQEQLNDAILIIYSRGDDRANYNPPYSMGLATGPKVGKFFSEEKLSIFLQEQIYPLLEQGKYEEAILQTNQVIVNFLNKYELKTNSNSKSSFLTIIQNYYHFILAILGLSLVFVLVLALRNFSSTRQNHQNHHDYAINGSFQSNSSAKVAAVDVGINNPNEPDVFWETINIEAEEEPISEVSNLDPPVINISEKIAPNQSQTQKENKLDNIEFISNDQENQNQEFIDSNIEHTIDFNTLELISLDELENVVNEFQDNTLRLFEFVKNQEEELKIKCDLVEELKEELAQSSPVEQLILESKLQELEDSTKLLEKTLVGQRTNLHKQQTLLAQYLIIFNRRKIQENTKSLETIDYEKLENMPLNNLEKLVDNLRNSYLNLVNLVNSQEEELKTQRYFLKQLEEKLGESSPIKQSILEIEIEDTKEVIELLNKTLFGQRQNLKIKEKILKQHVSIVNQKKIQLNDQKDAQISSDSNLNKVENEKHKIIEKQEESDPQIEYLSALK